MSAVLRLSIGQTDGVLLSEGTCFMATWGTMKINDAVHLIFAFCI